MRRPPAGRKQSFLYNEYRGAIQPYSRALNGWKTRAGRLGSTEGPLRGARILRHLVRGDHDTVPTQFLGSVESLIGSLQQPLVRPTMNRIQRHTDRNRHTGDRLSILAHRHALQLDPKLLKALLRIIQGDFRKDDNELFTAVATYDIAAAEF